MSTYTQIGDQCSICSKTTIAPGARIADNICLGPLSPAPQLIYYHRPLITDIECSYRPQRTVGFTTHISPDCLTDQSAATPRSSHEQADSDEVNRRYCRMNFPAPSRSLRWLVGLPAILFVNAVVGALPLVTIYFMVDGSSTS